MSLAAPSGNGVGGLRYGKAFCKCIQLVVVRSPLFLGCGIYSVAINAAIFD